MSSTRIQGSAPAQHDSARDPGLDGVVPFRFACHRCGHCCSGGSGYVWLAGGEIERMAEMLGASAASFSARHVRSTHDPRTGEARSALREVANEGGRCTLLVGRNTCSVYDARPAHCRAFPYWPSVMQTRDGFEAARATCPGIAVQVDAAVKARAFAALEAFYADLEPTPEPATCCLSRSADDVVFATALEVDFALEGFDPDRSPRVARDESTGAATAAKREVGLESTSEMGRGPCAEPAHHGADAPGMNAPDAAPTAGCCFGARRPLACRIESDHESRLGAVRAIERWAGYPAAYSELKSMLVARTRNPGNSA